MKEKREKAEEELKAIVAELQQVDQRRQQLTNRAIELRGKIEAFTEMEGDVPTTTPEETEPAE